MKKIFVILLAAAMLFTLVACGTKPEDDASSEEPKVAEGFVALPIFGEKQNVLI